MGLLPHGAIISFVLEHLGLVDLVTRLRELRVKIHTQLVVLVSYVLNGGICFSRRYEVLLLSCFLVCSTLTFRFGFGFRLHTRLR